MQFVSKTEVTFAGQKLFLKILHLTYTFCKIKLVDSLYMQYGNVSHTILYKLKVFKLNVKVLVVVKQ